MCASTCRTAQCAVLHGAKTTLYMINFVIVVFLQICGKALTIDKSFPGALALQV